MVNHERVRLSRRAYSIATTILDISAWVKNLTQTQYENFRLDVADLSYCGCAIAPPRMVGGTFTYRWQ